MLILGIETSCDETSAAVVEDGVRVRSNVIASSQATFRLLAGVIPEEAARRQVECMMPVILLALTQAGAQPDAIDAIAVTRGPGLLGSLLVGAVAARMLAAVWRKPLIGVHHTFGHLSSTWLDTDTDPPLFPLLTLSASGGHTDLWFRSSHLRGSLLGRTRDDAAGEAFDKGASMLGLPYPGGPSVAAAAESGDAGAHAFPQPLHGDDSLDYSFSGLKTSLRYLLRDLEPALQPPSDPRMRDFAASYQHAICRHLVDRLTRAFDRHPNVREIHLVGGVSANMHLRELAGECCARAGVRLRVPLRGSYCTDNAAMIAAAGTFHFREEGENAFAAFDTAASIPLESVMAG